MRAVLQRVTHASVDVDGETIGAIGPGLLLLLGAGQNDDDAALTYVLEKSLNLRIFADDDGKMNLSLIDIGGELLVVSQFTLYADTIKGRRPGFGRAMAPNPAEVMYETFVTRAKELVAKVETGKFGADMKVSLLNDGPVTILLDSEKTF